MVNAWLTAPAAAPAAALGVAYAQRMWRPGHNGSVGRAAATALNRSRSGVLGG